MVREVRGRFTGNINNCREGRKGIKMGPAPLMINSGRDVSGGSDRRTDENDRPPFTGSIDYTS